MTDAAQLREAIKHLNEQITLTAKLGRAMFSTRLSEASIYRDCAQTLLSLLEAHGDGIQGLLDGTHEIGLKTTPLILIDNLPLSEVRGRPTHLICKDYHMPLWPLPDQKYEYFVRNAKEG